MIMKSKAMSKSTGGREEEYIEMKRSLSENKVQWSRSRRER